jgi:flagellar basal body-associated protein FliL
MKKKKILIILIVIIFVIFIGASLIIFIQSKNPSTSSSSSPVLQVYPTLSRAPAPTIIMTENSTEILKDQLKNEKIATQSLELSNGKTITVESPESLGKISTEFIEKYIVPNQ